MAAILWLGFAALLLAGCPSTSRAPRTPTPVPDEARAAIPGDERPFVADPLEGYPQTAPVDAESRLRDAHRALVRSGDTAAALAEAESLLTDPSADAPARVLAAQAEYLAGDAAAALERVTPVVQELPRYTAAQLIRGRAAEKLGRLPEAYASYRAVRDASATAAERAAVLEPRAIEIVRNRFRAALEQERTDAAAEHLVRLERWTPDALETLEAGRDLALARGAERAELAAVTRLLEREPDRRELLLRRGELELEVGDPSTGLQIFQRLAEAAPRDPELQERLEQAKFRWRLALLPAEVQEVSEKEELDRADFATLVHWLVPRVRTSRAPAGRIAGDILEHPRREEIARVVNLGLMEVDPTLHTFSPQRPVRRERVLAALLRAVESLAGGAPCLTEPVGRMPAAERVCEAAVRCELLAGVSACDAGGTVSGREALELVRRALKLFS